MHACMRAHIYAHPHTNVPTHLPAAKGSERIDVYSFGIALWELYTMEEV